MIDNKYIEGLIERFFDGKTSNKEEMELYSFFSGDKIPEHLQQYIPVFQFFETGMEDEFNQTQNKTTGTKKLTPKIRQWSAWIGIAASLLLLVTVFSKVMRNEPKSFDPYEGSYIIRNGKVITDMDVIRPELEETVAAAAKQQQTMEKMIYKLSNPKDYEDVKQEIQNQYCELINSFPDEKTRETVKEILNVECN